ncbi:MAG: type II toxin-antitoxin system VapC family toxin [Planctomycetes bacterium]|nr:type II toxin-antitoxin system VapC family toxin [Planctomycetota bacterium]
MPLKYLLDTHAWVWWNMAPKRLSRKARATMENAEGYSELLLSAISAWEFCRLLEKKRIGISCDPEEWMSEPLRMPKLRLVPLTPAIAYRSTILPQPFHDDPADQIIVVTAREENATIISKDRKRVTGDLME